MTGQSENHEHCATFRVLGWTSAALAIAAVGLYVGREIRERYRFRQRNQYDFFAHAGDSMPAAEYGVGI